MCAAQEGNSRITALSLKRAGGLGMVVGCWGENSGGALLLSLGIQDAELDGTSGLIQQYGPSYVLMCLWRRIRGHDRKRGKGDKGEQSNEWT